MYSHQLKLNHYEANLNFNLWGYFIKDYHLNRP